MPPSTSVINQNNAPVQVVALDSRVPEQVVSDKQYLKILQLTDLMARSLRVEEILQTFSREIAGLVTHSGYSFQAGQLPDKIQVGVIDGHHLSYHLLIEQMDLGELIIFRDTPFGSNEVCQLEDLLCAIVYPLRNALLYQEALVSAFQDPLTSTHNRAAMERMIPREVRLAQRHGQDLSLLVIDLDGFKLINDIFGHKTGDRVLSKVSATIQTALRDTDILFRYGGDEFIAVLPQTDSKWAKEVGERILSRLESLSADLDLGGQELSASIGVASLQSGDAAEQLFDRADQAMYRAKQGGKKQVVGL